MEFTFNITEKQAEELLISLSHRCKQDGIINTQKASELETFGRKLSRRFEIEFNWTDSQGKLRRVFEFFMKKKIKIRIRPNV